MKIAIFFEMTEGSKVSFVKLIARLIVLKEGNDILIYIFLNMMLNVVLNAVLNLFLNRISKIFLVRRTF